MELKTREGYTIISNEEYQACHDLAHMLPDLIKTVALNHKVVDEAHDQAKARLNRLAKLRRKLNDANKILGIFKMNKGA